MPSIEKRSDNTYRITVSCGYDSKGKKLRKSKTITLPSGLTKRQRDKELNRLAVLFEREVENGTYLDGEKITFEEFTRKWLNDYGAVHLAPKTLSRYNLLLARINAVIGHLKLSKLQPHHLVELYNNLAEGGIRFDYRYKASLDTIPLLKDNKKVIASQADLNTRTIDEIIKGGVTTADTASKISDAVGTSIEKAFTPIDKDKGLSAKTILHHHRLISSILNTAMQWQIIQSNPADRVKPPKVEKQEAAHYNDEQVLKMFNLLSQEPLKYQAAIYTALYGGLRLGEVVGLNWIDVDFEKGILTISKTSQYLPNIGIFEASTKNISSKRKIVLSAAALQVLQMYKVEQTQERLKSGSEWVDSGKIFVKRNGEPMFPSTPSSWFRKWLKKNDLPPLTFHQLRHTNASLLIAQGIDIATVAKRLGHSKISTTMDIYTHAIDKLDTNAASSLDNLLSGNTNLITKIDESF